MKFNDEQYFTAGEFAAICGVNKQTILYYDKIGLLPPAYKDDKNRRFYQVQHQEIFYLIEILQEMEMSLNEIKEFLANRTPESYIEKLKEQHTSVQEKIKRLQHAERFIADQIQVEQTKNTEHTETIELIQNKAFQLLCSEEIQQFSSLEKSKKLARLMEQLQVNGANIGHAIGAILSKEHITAQSYSNYSYYCVFNHPLFPKNLQVKRLKIQGDFLVTYHKGSIETIGQTYEKLCNYATEKKLTIGAYAIEKSIYGFVHDPDANKHLIKIYLQIEE